MNTETSEQTIDRLKRERDAALAACAEWRALSVHICCFNEECHTGGEACDVCRGVEHALSSDCGHGFLPPDKVKVLVEALDRIANRSVVEVKDDWEIAKQALAQAKEWGICED